MDIKEKKTALISEIDLVVNVNGPLNGGIMDWPANIQDGIFAALERKCKENNCKYDIIVSFCDHDVDLGFYISVKAIGEITKQ